MDGVHGKDVTPGICPTELEIIYADNLVQQNFSQILKQLVYQDGMKCKNAMT